MPQRIQKGITMGILSWILMGALAGWLASKITGFVTVPLNAGAETEKPAEGCRFFNG